MFGAFFDAAMKIPDYMHDEEMQNDAQQFSSNEAMTSRAYNSAEAAAQRNWQEQMASTAYQRATSDMKNAGLNPMLAYHQGGSHAGSGSAASSSPPSSGIASTASGRGTNFTAAQYNASQIAVNDAVEERTRAEAAKIRAEENEVRERTPTHAVNIDKMRQDINESIERIHNIREQVGQTAASAAELRQRTVNQQETVAQIRSTVNQLKALTDLTKAQTTEAMVRTGLSAHQIEEIQQRLRQDMPKLLADLQQLEAQQRMLGMPAKRNEQAIEDSWLGITSRILQRLNPLKGLISIAK